MQKLAIQVLTSGGGVGTVYPAPKVLVVAPPPLAAMPDRWFHDMFEGGHEKSAGLAGQYRAMADFMKIDVFDAGSVVTTAGVDGIHFTAENNAALGASVVPTIRVYSDFTSTMTAISRSLMSVLVGLGNLALQLRL